MLTSITNFVFSFSVSVFLFSFLAGSIRFWDLGSTHITPDTKTGLLFACGLLLLSLILSLIKRNLPTLGSNGFALGLCMLFLSDWLARDYNFFGSESFRGEILTLGLAGTFLLKIYKKKSLYFLLPIFSPLCLYIFLQESKGRLIFSDDHGTFLYRLIQLKEQFPNIPFYNPFWNAGWDSRDFFATGALNLFTLGAPLIYNYPVEQIYTLLIGLILFVFFPCVIYFTGRFENSSVSASSIAGLLSLSISLIWYRWSLHFGTMGFITTCTLIPLVFAFGNKIIAKNESLNFFQSLLLIITTTLMLFWSLSGIVFIPILIWALLRFRTLWKSKYIKFILLGLLTINLPWIAMFFKVSKVGKFIQVESLEKNNLEVKHETDLKPKQSKRRMFKHKTKSFSSKEVLKNLKKNIYPANPLLLFFLIPGIFLFPKRERLFYGITFVWLSLLGTVAVSYKPQFELDRMLLILLVLGCIPAGKAISNLLLKNLENFNTKSFYLYLPLQIIVTGFLLASPLITIGIIKNRGKFPYFFADKQFKEFTNFLKNKENKGRILFSGCIVHDFSHGHVYPLPYFTNQSFVASSPVHNLWWYTDVFPPHFLNKNPEEGKLKYMNLMNISSIFAHESKERKFFRSKPNEFKEVWQNGSFSYFERLNYKPNYFLEGEGKMIEQNMNSIKLKISSTSAIIKFRYFDFLQAKGCKISAFNAAPKIDLIKLENCPDKEIVISSVSPFKRFLSN